MSIEPKKILIIDDELKITEVLKSYLEHSGFIVYEASTGNQALALFEKTTPSLVILDLMLPDINGEEICKILRSRSRVPIIMLTAKVEEKDIVEGLNIGADDYITKPFSPKQVVAKVIAILRRVSDDPIPLSNFLTFLEGDLTIDALKREVKKNRLIVNLTPNEYNILMLLVKYPAKTFSRDELIEHALSDDYDGYDRIIDTHIKNLRQKIETEPKTPHYIKTVHGIGYRWGGD